MASKEYSPVRGSDSKDSDTDSESMGLLLSPEMTFQRRRRALWPWIAHIILFTVSLSLFVTGTLRWNRSTRNETSIEPGWTREYGMHNLYFPLYLCKPGKY
jgi:hypothetical protein